MVNRIYGRTAVAVSVAAVVGAAAVLVHPWAAARAQGVHHPVAHQGPGPVATPPASVPVFTLAQAQGRVPYHIVTPHATVLPGLATQVYAHLHGTPPVITSLYYTGGVSPSSQWTVNIYESPAKNFSGGPNPQSTTLAGLPAEVDSWTGGSTPLADAYTQVGPHMWYEVTGFNVPLPKVEAILVDLVHQYKA